MPHTGSTGLVSDIQGYVVSVLTRRCFVVGLCVMLANVSAWPASSRTRYHLALSKLRVPRPIRLCSCGPDEDIISSSTP